MKQPQREAPAWATRTEKIDGRQRHVRDVGQVDLGDGIARIVVRVGQFAWAPAKPMGSAKPVTTVSPPFIDVRREGGPSQDIGGLTVTQALELAGLINEAARVARHIAGGTR